MTAILDDLTDAQREAVTHITGPLLVVAGPGSGKTRVITRRIAHLVYCGIRPWSILAITFTNKAADEMRRRVDQLVEQRGVWVSTFHAFCARQLREFAARVGYTRNFAVSDTDDSRRAVAAIMKDLELPREDWNAASIRDAISSYKARRLSPGDVAARAESTGGFRAATLAEVYERYEARLKAADSMDFDDLLLRMAELLEENDPVRRRLQDKYQFILVDEFQDTNRIQYDIARMLAEKHRNICATGDPDQSIYGWRGADLRNILDFEQDFPEAKVVFLDRNYRSTGTILAAADSLVANNLARKERRLYTTNEAGSKIALLSCDDGQEEADVVATAIAQEIASGTPPSGIAVFYRVGWLSRQIEEALLEKEIPYQIVGGVEFYNRKEIRDVLAYMRVAANPADEAALLRILNVPPRGLGEKSVDALKEYAQTSGVGLFEALSAEAAQSSPNARAREGLAQICATVQAVRQAGNLVEVAVRAAMETSGYVRWLESSKKEEDRERIDNLRELVSAAAQFDAGSMDATLTDFLDRVALSSDIDNWEQRAERVTLMTMHAAKGLEFPVVFIVGLEESILPHERSVKTLDEVEEERRVFFVAMTRAMKRLYLATAYERLVFGAYQHNLVSRFLREIPPGLIEDVLRAEAVSPAREAAPLPRPSRERRESQPGLPKKGALVRSAVFGIGVVESVTSQGGWHKATVKFKTAGTKKLILEKAGLEIMNK